MVIRLNKNSFEDQKILTNHFPTTVKSFTSNRMVIDPLVLPGIINTTIGIDEKSKAM